MVGIVFPIAHGVVFFRKALYMKLYSTLIFAFPDAFPRPASVSCRPHMVSTYAFKNLAKV